MTTPDRRPHDPEARASTRFGARLRAITAPTGRWLGRWLLVPVAAAALAVAAAAVLRVRQEARPVDVTIATGGNRGLRARLLRSLETEPNPHRVRARGTMIPGMEAALRQLDAGRIQFAMIQAGSTSRGTRGSGRRPR